MMMMMMPPCVGDRVTTRVGKPGSHSASKAESVFGLSVCDGVLRCCVVDEYWINRKSLILRLTFTIFEPMGMSHARL